MNRLKCKIYIVLAIAVTAALAIFSPGIAWWRCLSYQKWEADFFGKQVYNTYLYNASLLERLAVSNVMATAEDAFSYIGDRESAER